MGTSSNIRNQQYRTEPDIRTVFIGLKRAEFNIISDIGKILSDIQHPMLHRLASWLSGNALAYQTKRSGINCTVVDMSNNFFTLYIGMGHDVNIGALHILE